MFGTGEKPGVVGEVEGKVARERHEHEEANKVVREDTEIKGEENTL